MVAAKAKTVRREFPDVAPDVNHWKTGAHSVLSDVLGFSLDGPGKRGIILGASTPAIGSGGSCSTSEAGAFSLTRICLKGRPARVLLTILFFVLLGMCFTTSRGR